jgi:hypothetical protein
MSLNKLSEFLMTLAEVESESLCSKGTHRHSILPL